MGRPTPNLLQCLTPALYTEMTAGLEEAATADHEVICLKDTKRVVVGLGVSSFVSWPRPSHHCFSKLPMILLEPPQTDSEVKCTS